MRSPKLVTQYDRLRRSVEALQESVSSFAAFGDGAQRDAAMDAVDALRRHLDRLEQTLRDDYDTDTFVNNSDTLLHTLTRTTP